jgi:ADP-heptose:LPS heptosyltransferase
LNRRSTLREDFLAFRNVLAFWIHGRSQFQARGSKVAIFKPDRIGDFILAVGAIRAIADAYGEDECVLFISPMVEELARREFPRAGRVLIPPFALKLWPAWRELTAKPLDPWWNHSFKVAISLRHHRMKWQELLFGRIRCVARWGLENRWVGDHPFETRHIVAPLTGRIPAPSKAPDRLCLELESHRLVLERVFSRPVAPEQMLPILRPAAGAKVRNSLLVFPFSSERIKDIPEGLLVNSLRQFLPVCGLALEFAFTPADRPRYMELAAKLAHEGLPVPTLVETTSLGALIERVEGCSAVLSADTGPAHIAGALDKPMVALLGGGHFGTFAPWRRSERQEWLSHPMDCYQCQWFCKHSEPYCITRISPESVAGALTRVVRSAGSKPNVLSHGH